MAESIQRPGAPWTRRAAWVFLAVLVATTLSQRLFAHEIPASVVIHTFARPQGPRLQLLVRMPLVSMRDFIIPAREGVLLDLPRVQPMLGDMVATWLTPSITLLEDGRPLAAPRIAAARISLPSDQAFRSFDTALAHMADPPLDAAIGVPITEAMLDVLLEYPITSDRARFAIDPQFARFGLRVVTTMQFQLPDQPERAFEFTGDPGLVQLDPRWHQVALRFVRAGFAHILDGTDHLLFLLCLVLPYRRFWDLVKVITAFTVAHSITLFCSAFGLVPDALWFPPLIETLIAVSIVYMAIENIVVVARGTGLSTTGFPHSITRGKPVDSSPVPAPLRRRWLIAFGFGLVHGFGFSFALRETLQFAGAHLVTSLVSFNVGVELGQLLVLAVALPLLAILFRKVIEERLGVIIASALITHTAWHWMVDRAAVLRQYNLTVSGPAALASVLRAAIVVVAVAAIVWIWRASRRSGRS